MHYLSETSSARGMSLHNLVRTLRSDDGSVGGVELEAFVLFEVRQTRRRARLGQALLVARGGHGEERVLSKGGFMCRIFLL